VFYFRKIDIKNEEEKRKEVEIQLADLEIGATAVESHPLSLPEIHDEVVAVLRAGGYDTAEKVIAADPDQLAALPGFDRDTVDAVVAAAKSQQASEQRAASEAEAPVTDEPAADEQEKSEETGG